MNNTQFEQVMELMRRMDSRLNRLESSKPTNTSFSSTPDLTVNKDVKANAIEVREYYMIYRPSDLESYRQFMTYLIVHRQELYLSDRNIDVINNANKTFKIDIRISDKVYAFLENLYERVYDHPWAFDWKKIIMYKDKYENITWEYM